MAETAAETTTAIASTKDIHALLNRKSVLDELRKVLPDDLSPERLTRISLTVIQKSPGLKKCTPLEIRPRHSPGPLRAFFADRRISLQSQTEELAPSRKESL